MTASASKQSSTIEQLCIIQNIGVSSSENDAFAQNKDLSRDSPNEIHVMGNRQN